MHKDILKTPVCDRGQQTVRDIVNHCRMFAFSEGIFVYALVMFSCVDRRLSRTR